MDAAAMEELKRQLKIRRGMVGGYNRCVFLGYTDAGNYGKLGGQSSNRARRQKISSAKKIFLLIIDFSFDKIPHHRLQVLLNLMRNLSF